MIYRDQHARRRAAAADGRRAGGRRAGPGPSPSPATPWRRKTAAAALVLDRSGSMAEDRGDGQTKHASLQQAASIFVDVMLEGDGVGLVRFNQDAQVLENGRAAGPAAGSRTSTAATPRT